MSVRLTRKRASELAQTLVGKWHRSAVELTAKGYNPAPLLKDDNTEVLDQLLDSRLVESLYPWATELSDKQVAGLRLWIEAEMALWKRLDMWKV